MVSLNGSYKHNKTMICPWCGKEVNGTTVATTAGENKPLDEHNEEARPEVGSIGLCAYCGGIQVYDEVDGEGALRKPNSDEDETARQNPMLQFMQAKLLDLRARRNADGTHDPAPEPSDEDDPDKADDDRLLFKVTFERGDEEDTVISKIKATIPKVIAIELLRDLVKNLEDD